MGKEYGADNGNGEVCAEDEEMAEEAVDDSGVI